ncbi:MAG: molybdopterin-binding protein [Acidilobaceae archaeon]
MREAWIISVGTELLRGRVVNTNAAWLADRLTKLGFSVSRVVTVPDSIDDIEEELRRALARAEVVVTTGGLGLGPDDVTLEAIARATGKKLVLHSDALSFVERYCKKYGIELRESRIKLAMAPEGAQIVENPVGAAPGIVLTHGDKLVIALPGPPGEVRAIFEKLVQLLVARAGRPSAIVECRIEIRDVLEADIAQSLLELRESLKGLFFIKSYPRGLEYAEPSVVVELSTVCDPTEVEKYLEVARKAVETVVAEAGKAKGSVVLSDCTAKSINDSIYSYDGNSSSNHS